ncbi:MAG TPA: DsrE family protein [Fibrobacteria bacterium]|nr:DsrE family protein [Fibrobacteria bacterium]
METDNPGKPSFFFGLMGTPYQSDLATSLFRMVQEALAQGHEVVVWTCGYGTMLTQRTLVRPPDMFEDGQGVAAHPTTAELVQSMFRSSRGHLKWFVCRYCMEERGAVHQIEEVSVKIPFTFQHYLNKADIPLVLGVKS